MDASLLPRVLPREVQLLFPKSEVTGIDDLGNDVDAVFDLERNEIRFSVLDFIENGLLARCGTNVGKGIVVIDGRDEERLAGGLRVEFVIEAQFRSVARTKLIDLFGRMRLRGMNLFGGLLAKVRQFLFVGF